MILSLGMSFRKEKKAALTHSDLIVLKEKLLSKGMKSLYPSRRINSLYFDTRGFRMFEESEEGLTPRKKIRIRWYNESSTYSLEKKISSIEGRFKETEKIPYTQYEYYKKR